jgi:hypothetical protein
MGASEWIGRGKSPNALRAKGIEKEEEEEILQILPPPPHEEWTPTFRLEE